VSRIVLVVAVARNGVIGANGGLPWHIPSDLKRFKAMTMGKPVIMGRKTWESLPVRPLPGRLNVVITRDGGFHAPGAVVVTTAEEALAAAAGDTPDEIAVIGGADIFRMFLPRANRIYFTDIDIAPEGDTFFPKLTPEHWREISAEAFAQGPKDTAPFRLRVLDRTGEPGHY
jgi:dihydrofolate reductase